MEKDKSKMRFEPPDGPADRRAGNAELFRGAGKGAAAHRRFEGDKRIERGKQVAKPCHYKM
jgi:hypothetical protein